MTADNPAQGSDGLLCVGVGWMTKIEADAVAEFLLGRKNRPGGDADALLEGLPLQGQCVDGLRQFDPDKVSSGRPGQTGGGRKMPFNFLDQAGFLEHQLLPQAA